MNSQNDSQGRRAGHAAGNLQGGHEASGKHQGLRDPGNDEAAKDALDSVGLDDRGAAAEDHLRDRRGKGVRGAYDDSIDHDAYRGFVEPGAAEHGPRDT